MHLTPGLRRFLRYTLVGVSTLAFDLALLWVLVTFAHVPYYIGTPLSFLVAVSLNYAISRSFVFRGTERPMHHGYLYFVLIAGAGALFITLAVAGLVAYAHLYYLLARILVAGFVGIANYLLNLHFNFRVAGKHYASSISES